MPPTGIDLVCQILTSFDGGFSGLNTDFQIGSTINEDGTIAYSLTNINADPQTVDTFVITVVATGTQELPGDGNGEVSAPEV